MSRRCFLCGSQNNIERHHVFGGANRGKSERYGLVVDLCHAHHNEPPLGAHHNRETDLYLKRLFQQKAMNEQGWTEADFIRAFGRNYL